MVKGVNKTVIEINDTGNNMFEKIILFVTPQYSNLNLNRLKSEAEKTINDCSAGKLRMTVRQKNLKKRKIIALCIATAIAAIALASLLILK